ncbi:2-amino-4-hydroxy-6-hydroxymethyldihydropteridine diphosphokinase [Sphingomonas sp. PAMC 26621]|uniref:2-amino-4-hydroxy-6- hydroxymethyldihydropteridine diphosphokinase n=1 Tax=Sphingomonas sp. PAMC 26621 TaxID=1112213 RepID=UPI000289C426|nr:2-amino-4-hydroxy-6-hydroxymethyldihydropteridine diphosphokinase [Sphingomonas sp. PAMC 26621]
MTISTTSPHYAIAIGSNRRGRHGGPRAEVTAAIAALPGVIAVSRLIETTPVGPSSRRFVNAVVVVACTDSPPELLRRLKTIERDFGRRRGRRWAARVIDLDIVLWSGGAWRSPGLRVPHLAYADRDFVLGPLATIAPRWRDPSSGRTIRQLASRLRKVDPTPIRS